MSADARFLVVSEVAELLRCDDSTVRRYVRAGRLKAFKPGGRVLIPKDAVDEFLAQSAVEPPAPPPRYAREARPRSATQHAGVSFRERAKQSIAEQRRREAEGQRRLERD